MRRILDIGQFTAVCEAGLAKLVPTIPRITVCMGTCVRGNGAEEAALLRMTGSLSAS